MRRSLLLFSILLLSFCWAAAQDSTSQSAPNQTSPDQPSTQTQPTPNQMPPDQTADQATPSNAGGETTVRGCLSNSNGNFMLTDKSGNTYQLMGDNSKMSEHVGHEVKVTGTASAAPASGASSSDAMGQSGSSSQTLQVTSLKHISKTCQAGNNSMSH
jgi:hypothetical protein